MNTRPHLAAAPEPPPDESTPEERFARLAGRIYADRRAVPAVRELLLAVGYAVTVGRAEDGGAAQMWATVRCALAGRPGRVQELGRLDLPRYVAPGEESWVEGTCEAARHRPYVPQSSTGYGRALAADDWRNADGVCGASGTIRVTERDLRNGRHLLHWFCGRHRDQAARVAAQLVAQNEQAPEPVPNAGGLLPAYFRADWLTFYRGVSSPTWEPPVYGMSADGWPDASAPVSAHPRMRLVPVTTAAAE
ncbi:hypothetical protein ACFV1L_21920 [Kitasatospora sp. NPDC059646]|uniref:hypothetical protein n=1 Tax=Kitasatospora sp. NPDC059646 TaxID=3346893 RepID=UPI0036B75E10